MSTFPQLLRRSQFATFDPSITRVYTSTPHSINRYGDWGLKSPIHRPKGPRYIKLSKLDAGSLLGSDWRSAEPEARFLAGYGTGQVGWTAIRGRPSSYNTDSRSADMFEGFDEDESELYAGSPLGKEAYMDDINSMSPSEFARYMSEVRSNREEFVRQKIASLPPSARRTLQASEDMTGVHLVSKTKNVGKADRPIFQVAMADRRVDTPDSKVLRTKPHGTHGLMYSTLPYAAGTINPLSYRPGRALDVSHGDNRPQARHRPGSSSFAPNTNQSWVVSIGGAGAESSRKGASTITGAAIRDGVDYTREDLARGEETFTISRATLRHPPRVVAVPGQNVGRRRMPLDTMAFTITVKTAGESDRKDTDILGSREYVFNNARTTGLALGSLGSVGYGSEGAGDLPAQVGAPKAVRRAGEASAALNMAQKNMTADSQRSVRHNGTIQDILSRLKKQRKV